MKKIYLFITALLFVFSGVAQKYRYEQNFKRADLEYLKNADVYLGLSKENGLDSALRKALEESWRFTEIVGEDSIESLKKKMKDGKNIAFIAIVKVGSSNLFSDKSGVDAKSTSYGIQLNIKGNKYGFYHQYLCYAEGFNNNKDLSIDLGVKILNSKLNTIDKKGLSKSKKLKKVAQQRADVFSKKTLYIPREWLDGISEEEFKSKYTKSIKFVDLEEYINAIKDGKEDMIFALPIAVPAEGGFVNTHVFVEADGYQYLGICQRLTFSEMQSNIFNDYSGMIEKAHARLYDKTSDGKW